MTKACASLQVAAHPRLRVAMRGIGGDHPEPVVVELGHRQVGFQRPGLVEPLGVGDPAGLAVDLVGRDPVQDLPGVTAAHVELGHEGHIHQDHAGARGVMLGLPVAEPVRPPPGQLAGLRLSALGGIPVGALPAADVPEVRPLRHQPVVDRRQLRAPGGPHGPARVVGLVHQAQRLDRASRPVLRIGLVAVQPVDVDGRHVDVGPAVGDPVRDHPADSAAGQDPDRVQPGRHEVVLQLRRFADDRQQVRGETLRAAEELLDACLLAHRDPGHGALQVGRHPVPVRRQLAEGEIRRDALDLPRRADRLEQAEHQPAALLAVVAVAGRVLQHRPAAVHPLDRLSQQVVVLGGLQRDVHPGQLAELPGPDPGTVDDVLGLEVTVRRADPGHRAAALQEAGDGRAFDDPHAPHPGPPGQRHGHIDRVHPAIARDVEAGQHVIDPGQRKQAGHRTRRDLLHLYAAQPVERGHPPVLLQPPRLDGQLDQPDLLQAGREPGLRLQPGVQVPGVHPQLGRGLRGRAEGGHEPGRVPGGTRGQPVALQQDHIGHPALREVIGDRDPDDAAADDDDASAVRDCGGARHGHATRMSDQSGTRAAAVRSGQSGDLRGGRAVRHAAAARAYAPSARPARRACRQVLLGDPLPGGSGRAKCPAGGSAAPAPPVAGAGPGAAADRGGPDRRIRPGRLAPPVGRGWAPWPLLWLIPLIAWRFGWRRRGWRRQWR